jgi:hypothetical protein
LKTSVDPKIFSTNSSFPSQFSLPTTSVAVVTMTPAHGRAIVPRETVVATAHEPTDIANPAILTSWDRFSMSLSQVGKHAFFMTLELLLPPLLVAIDKL